MNTSYLKIENYRCIKKCSFSLSDFGCIIGENNTGKSSILLAMSLFFSGTKLYENDFYDNKEQIKIEMHFENINNEDLNRLALEHKNRIQDLIKNGSLKLVRIYDANGSSNLFMKKLVPKEENLRRETYDVYLKGAKPKEIETIIRMKLADFAESFDFKSINSQTLAKEAIEKLVSELSEEELIEDIVPLATGIPNSIKELLPEHIYIPAVKDLSDDIKTRESATFGKLINVLLRFIEGTKEVKQIVKSFDELNKILNIIDTEEGKVDNRIQQLKDIERVTEDYLKDNFPNIKVELKIPKPELKQVFSNTQIFVDDGINTIIDTKGDGLKRALVFALLRTYIDLNRLDKEKEYLQENKEENKTNSHPPILFLFEEPELYLHPNGQKILFEALKRLTSFNNQVLVTTHSPIFLSPDNVGYFIKITKTFNHGEKPYSQVLPINLEFDLKLKDAYQLICFENNSAAFFANKVLLVEGISDLIYLKHISKKYNEEWDFESKNIPIIGITGKTNIKKFVEFFELFGVEVHTILDYDMLLDGFEHLNTNNEIKRLRNDLLQEVDTIINSNSISVKPSGDDIKKLITSYSWSKRYERLKLLVHNLKCGQTLNEAEQTEVDMLFELDLYLNRKKVLKDDTFKLTKKTQLINELRENKIYILEKGTIDNYYHKNTTGKDKPSRALNAREYIHSKDDIDALCNKCKINGTTKSEFQLVFESIFR